MAATAHLPKEQPKGENDMPQGVKNWDKPPQQYDPPKELKTVDVGPTPWEAGAGEQRGAKKPQQVAPKKSDAEVQQPGPSGEMDYDPRPQQIDGPEGPDPTDGTELIDQALSYVPADTNDKGGPTAVTGRKAAPAKKAAAKKGASGSPLKAAQEGTK